MRPYSIAAWSILVGTLVFGTAWSQSSGDTKRKDHNGGKWVSLLPERGLEGLAVEGNWRRAGDELNGESREGSAVLKFGLGSWRDYEVAFRVTVNQGGNLDVGFRSTGKQAYVFKFLLGRQACTVTLRDLTGKEGLKHLSVVDHRLERGKEYDVRIAVRGSLITTYVDGRAVNELSDRTLEAGAAYLEVWQGDVTFRNVRYRRTG